MSTTERIDRIQTVILHRLDMAAKHGSTSGYNWQRELDRLRALNAIDVRQALARQGPQ